MSELLQFKSLPSMVWPYVRVLTSRKPLLASVNTLTPIHLQSRVVRIDPAHLLRYCQVCELAPSDQLPLAYLHVLAMPLHMRLFTHAAFPVKVLGLVHLRNRIHQQEAVSARASLQLSVALNALRETASGQEYDIITRAYLPTESTPVWEEIATMLARRLVPGKRPVIERAARDEATLMYEQNLHARANTGLRYARVSGDFNPIHLFNRTAQAFQFKQTVAHGM